MYCVGVLILGYMLPFKDLFSNKATWLVDGKLLVQTYL